MTDMETLRITVETKISSTALVNGASGYGAEMADSMYGRVAAFTETEQKQR